MSDTITLIITIGSAILALASAAFSCFTYFRNVRHDRRRDTLEAFNILQNEVFDKLNQYLPSDIIEFTKHPTAKEYNEIGAMVARIEHFCVGVKQKIYDRKTVYELAHGYFDGEKLKRRIEPIIGRKNSQSEHDYYSNIHWMLEWMDCETGKREKKQP